MNAIRESDGPRAIALAKGTTGGTSISDSERWLSRFLNFLGSPNWVSTTHVCNWHKDTGFTYTFGVEIPTTTSRTVIFFALGHNPSSTSLILAHDIVAARKRGMKIVAVDPRRVGIAGQADILLQVRPGTDGALALALIDVVIKQKLYDEAFVRQWTNGSFLLRADTGAPLTEADLNPAGSSERFVAWDERGNTPVVYDPVMGRFAIEPAQLALSGEWLVTTKGGEILCRPVFAALALLAATYNPEASAVITGVPAEKVKQAARLLAANRPVSMFMHNGVGQHTNATQTSRAIATLYALLGDFDRPGGNVVFPKAPVNVVSGRNLCRGNGRAKNRARAKAARTASQARQLRRLRYLYRDPRRPSLSCEGIDQFRLEHDHVHGRFPTGARSVSCRRLRRGYGAVHDSYGRAL